MGVKAAVVFWVGPSSTCRQCATRIHVASVYCQPCAVTATAVRAASEGRFTWRYGWKNYKPPEAWSARGSGSAAASAAFRQSSQTQPARRPEVNNER